MSETHDLAIVGAGSGGIIAARFAAGAGARVAANQQLASAYSVERFLGGRAGKLMKRLGGLR